MIPDGHKLTTKQHIFINSLKTVQTSSYDIKLHCYYIKLITLWHSMLNHL